MWRAARGIVWIRFALGPPATPPVSMSLRRNALSVRNDFRLLIATLSGIPWGHLSTVLGLVVVCVFGISAAAKYRSKMREERHTVSTTMLGGGFMARLGVRRAATTHRFRDVATETE